jgi:hypothetical protein
MLLLAINVCFTARFQICLLKVYWPFFLVSPFTVRIAIAKS